MKKGIKNCIDKISKYSKMKMLIIYNYLELHHCFQTMLNGRKIANHDEMSDNFQIMMKLD